MEHRKIESRESGVSLIEMAIVLVVIGLLIGGVLKGSSLIQGAKVKKAAAIINNVAAAHKDYVAQHRAQPGDDGDLTRLQNRGALWSDVTAAGNRNGVININNLQTFNPGTPGSSESDNYWQHLKAGEFIKGDPSVAGQAALLKNPFGGLVGVTTASINNGLTGVKVCMSGLPSSAASSLDILVDNGNGETGNLRATRSNPNVRGTIQAPATGTTTTTYVENRYYTVCMRI